MAMADDSEQGVDVPSPVGLASAVYVSARKETRLIGFALVDGDAATIQLCQLEDTPSYTYLEALLLQCHPATCDLLLTPELADEEKKIRAIGTRCECEVRLGSHPHVSTGLDELFEQRGNSRFAYKESQQTMVAASQALSSLVHALGLLLDSSSYGHFTFRLFPMECVVRLDKAAFSALHLLPEDKTKRPTDPSSLLGLLNKCRTAFGLQRLRLWICQPSSNRAELLQRQDIVGLLIQHADLRRCCQQDHLRLLPHLDTCVARFRRGCSKPLPSMLQEVLNVQKALLEAHGILALLGTLVCRIEDPSEQALLSLKTRLVDPLDRALSRTRKYHELVEYTLDPDEAKRGHAVMNPDFDPELRAAAHEKKRCEQNMEDHRRDVQEDLGLSRGGDATSQAVKLIECSAHGYVFRVTKKDQKYVQAAKDRYRQVRINKAEFQFTTRELTALALEYRELARQCDDQQAELATKTVAAAVTYWPVLESLVDILSELDVFCSFAEVAEVNGYVQPVLLKDDEEPRRIVLEDARHPLLEATLRLSRLQHNFTADTVIPNSMTLDATHARVHLVTGPNMGGKSTYIRQTALICLMAQLGCYVPCKRAELSLVDAILCRVGASDDQLRGISTFFAEMIEASAVLSAATCRSLVVVDELGRGTSTFEGFGLAWEIARTLAVDIRCFCLFATHFYELSDLAKVTPGVVNRRVRVHVNDHNQLAFPYSVEPGCADVSYGVRIAELVGLDSAVVRRAKEHAAMLEQAEQRLFSGRKRPLTEDDSHDAESSEKSRASLKRLCQVLHLKGLETLSDQEFRDHCFQTVPTTEVC